MLTLVQSINVFTFLQELHKAEAAANPKASDLELRQATVCQFKALFGFKGEAWILMDPEVMVEHADWVLATKELADVDTWKLHALVQDYTRSN